MDLKELDNILDEGIFDSDIHKSFLNIENMIEKVKNISTALEKVEKDSKEMNGFKAKSGFIKTLGSNANTLNRSRDQLDKLVSQYYSQYDILFLLLNKYPSLQKYYGTSDANRNKIFPKLFYIIKNEDRDAGGKLASGWEYPEDTPKGMKKIINNLEHFKSDLTVVVSGKYLSSSTNTELSQKEGSVEKTKKKFIKFTNAEDEILNAYTDKELRIMYNILFGSNITEDEELDFSTTDQKYYKALYKYLVYVKNRKKERELRNLIRSKDDFRDNFKRWYDLEANKDVKVLQKLNTSYDSSSSDSENSISSMPEIINKMRDELDKLNIASKKKEAAKQAITNLESAIKSDDSSDEQDVMGTLGAAPTQPANKNLK